MLSKRFSRLLVAFSLLSLLILPSGGAALADPPPPLETQIFPLQPAIGDRDLVTSDEIGAMSTIVFYPCDDAPVLQGAPNSPAPDSLLLGAGYYDDPRYGPTGLVRSYLRFDLSSLPTAVNIASATLHLYHLGGSDYYPNTLRTVNFHRVTGAWNENAITWNDHPSHAEIITSTETTYDYAGWVSLDVTDQVRAWVDGSQNNYGLVAIGPESTAGVYRLFTSGEEVHRPELHIHFATVPPPVLDVSPGTLSIKASNTKQLSVQISNVTTDTLNWTATKLDSAPWLTLNDSAGSVTPTNPDNLGLTVNPTVVTPGVYTAQVRISSNTPGVAGSPLAVTVTLEAFDFLSQVYLPTILNNWTGSSPPRVVALLIGIADYQHLDPPPQSGGLPDFWGYDLVAPAHDERDFAILLQTKYGIPPQNILRCGECSGMVANTALTSDGSYQASTLSCISPATRANVFAAFAELDQKEDENTIVIFYFSGHGGQTRDEPDGDESDGFDEFIAMYDTNQIASDRYTDVISDDDLQALLATLESRHIVVILDSCYSGSMMSLTAQSSSSSLLRRGLVNPVAPGVNVQGDLAAMTELVQPGRLIITAGTGDQPSWESSELENGVFTYYFLQGLEDTLHDTNQNGMVSFEEAYWFSRDVVDAWVFSRQGEHQNPDISDRHFGQIELP